MYCSTTIATLKSIDSSCVADRRRQIVSSSFLIFSIGVVSCEWRFLLGKLKRRFSLHLVRITIGVNRFAVLVGLAEFEVQWLATNLAREILRFHLSRPRDFSRSHKTTEDSTRR